jgi:hypothetical protein
VVKIECFWHQWASLVIDYPETQSLTSGWSHYKGIPYNIYCGFRNADDGNDAGAEKFPYFTHASDPYLKFCFPTPFSTAETCTGEPGCVHCFPHITDKIRFRGMVGQFKLGMARQMTTQIITFDGLDAGTLWHHDENDEDYKEALRSDGPAVELAAIIGCVVARDDVDTSWAEPPPATVALGGTRPVPSSDHGHDRDQRPRKRSERMRQVYNVLWIQRRGDVAYRKGSGEVHREVWDRVVGGIEVDITLG